MDRNAPRGLIRKINADGFREWHSVELARSFGHLGLGVVMLVCALAIMEGVFDTPSLAERIFKMFLTFFSLCITGWCWLMFIQILMRAEELGRQAVCPQCGRYGRLRVIGNHTAAELGHQTLCTQCQKCDHVWDMTYTVQSLHVRF